MSHLDNYVPPGKAPLLTVEHLTMRFGGLTAVDDVSFTARNQHITAIIGPNGAGKTTVFNCLTGFYKPTVGRLTLRPPAGRWEKAVNRQLIVTERDTVYAEFLFDDLLRGDTTERYTAYNVATGGRPFMWPSEVRAKENLPADDELDEQPPQGAAVANGPNAERPRSDWSKGRRNWSKPENA